LRKIFQNLRRRNILQDVRTLILDGLAVPADLVTEIITQESFHVRILSIRDIEHMNERKLQEALLYAIRPSRPASMPKLQGIYIFGPKDSPVPARRQIRQCPQERALNGTVPSPGGLMTSQGARIGAQWNAKSGDVLAAEIARDKWFERSGKIFPGIISSDWASVVQACQGIISFDAVLCAGPRHTVLQAVGGTKSAWYNKPEFYIPPKVATHALDGCSGCGRAPEGLSKLGFATMDRFPLLAPPTLHSSTTKAAKTPSRGIDHEKKLLVRCIDCLRNRYCESCHQWWCEDCYEVANSRRNPKQPYHVVFESAQSDKTVKVHMGLCVERCLVGKMMSGW
jgi:hypothetical protein